MSPLAIIAWPLLALCGAAAVYWLMLGRRVLRLWRRRPTVREGIDLPPPPDGAPWPSVSIVVPAHNAQRTIDACAVSLRGQRYEHLEIILVLDRCTDGTRRIARRHAEADPRVTIVENDACPDDWAGKCNAARAGAERAAGDYVLFTDADTVFAPDLVRASVALARARGLGLLSLLSTLSFRHPWERVAQPVASMHLIRLFPIERVNRRGNRRAFANGQFMLFEHRWYERLGGHAAVKDDLLEDIAFARRLVQAGGHGEILFADGMLRCSMYDSPEALRRGWTRIFIEACKRKPARLRKNGGLVLAVGVFVPLVQVAALAVAAALLAGADPPLGAVLAGVVLGGWGAQTLGLLGAYHLAGAPARIAVFYPAGSWIVGRIMLAAARDLKRRRPIPWAGRQYVLEPR